MDPRGHQTDYVITTLRHGVDDHGPNEANEVMLKYPRRVRLAEICELPWYDAS